jgi:hypothetical protein
MILCLFRAGASPRLAAVAALTLSATGFCAIGAPVTASPSLAAAEAAPKFTVTSPATKVAARTDRRPVAGGVYDPHVNRTFISWAGRYQDSYVQAYDHAAGTWSAPRRIIDGRRDTHNYPTMLQTDDGHLLLFVGMHNVELVMARSPRPHSIEGTWTTRVIPQGAAASYPMPVRAANGDIFVFYRETSRSLDRRFPVDTRPLLYVQSTDDGRTWRSSKQITGYPYALGSTTRKDNLNEVYMGQLRYSPPQAARPERIDMVWTIAGGGPGRHAHAAILANVFYASFSPASRRFSSASGKDLGTQIDDTDQERHAKVMTTALEPPFVNFVQLVGVNDGRPFVLWHTHRGQTAADDYVSVWTGRVWQTTKVGTGMRLREMEPLAPGSAATWRVYTTRDQQPDITTYLVDPGRAWTKETVIPTPREAQRIELVDGFRDPARILATGASSSRDVTVADGDIHVIGISGAGSP